MESDSCLMKRINMNPVVKLSRSEFFRFALKYNVSCEVRQCNLKISHLDFDENQGKSKMNGINATKSITLTRSDFVKQSIEQKKVAAISKSKQPNPVDCYQLRKRKSIHQNVAPSTKRPRLDVVRKVPAPKFVSAQQNVLTNDLVVIAKMRTFAAWPGRITMLRKTCVTVQFFGDETTGNVSYSQIGLFKDNHKLVQSNLMKKINGYRKAIKSMEMVLGIPDHLSLLN